MSLDGQIAVVTGGSRGIGREVAKALARAGMSVAVTARNQSDLNETVQQITDSGGRAAAYPLDVTDTAAVHTTMDKIAADLGTIDLLVNNAGIGSAGTLPWETDVEDWWRVQEVNVKGVFACCHAVLPAMIARQSGRIINMGSYVGIRPNGDASEYAVSKAALVRLTDSIAEAAKAYNVQVFVISPGMVYTDMTRDLPFVKDLPDSAWTPIEKAGELCVFLATGQADRLTGRFIHASDEDVHELVRRTDEILENDLYGLRLRRFE